MKNKFKSIKYYYVKNWEIIPVKIILFFDYQSIAVEGWYNKKTYTTKKEYLFTSLSDAKQYLRVKQEQDKVFNIWYQRKLIGD